MNNRYIALIPARSGSKGIPNKNILNLLGQPLIFWSIQQALACTKIAEVFVSTDSPAIADIAKRNGAKVPELRPAHLAEDATPTEDVMLQVAQDWLDWEPNTVMILLQPTSPYRRPGTIASAIELFEKQNADSLVSVCESHSFFWKNPSMPSAQYDYMSRPRRQDLAPSERPYKENGSIYMTRLPILKAFGNRLGGKIVMFCMTEQESWEIDSPTDFKIVDMLMQQEKR
ncbi:hypothetical protein Q672_02115 [Marinobacter sp. EVN1]|uniref:acylneuraminate cytidylyltransferase family protein n=1 Tax=unclassified Marinobacter TaxID=83889 RepID=UPI0003B841AA|nr:MULTISPECIES: acylneuraminate cytidylyltransferase family protein [unclassified Marinobacter]ERS84274.1 hypothetical protein Q672_02115 [Marinobacter sp. EVN1]ERS85086.1 hypothetical protein Q667_17690 [Marinobacter sp. C1S70]